MNQPISKELREQLDQLNEYEQAFISGYLWAKSQMRQTTALAVGAKSPSIEAASKAADEATSQRITVLSASQTGNAHGVAKHLLSALQAEYLPAKLISAGDFKTRQLGKEDIILLVTSTQGEGEPPEEAVLLHHFLFSKRAPKLDDLSYAVLGLGDSSYPDFCQAAKDFDSQLSTLGAHRLLDRVDADLDFQATAKQWIGDIVAKLKSLQPQISSALLTMAAASAEAPATIYTRDNPYTAELLVRQPIVDIKSHKDIWHIEIDLGDSGLSYQVGDALGVFTYNAEAIVAEILALAGLSGDETVKGHAGEVSLNQALQRLCDINQLTPAFIKAYGELRAENIDIDLRATSLVALLHDYPIDKKLTAQDLYDGLKPLTPRLYSIASAQAEVGEEVHLCVADVSFKHHGNTYHGSASGLLGSTSVGDELLIFIEPNPRFRLPADSQTPIIMIGAGTGIAPYRGFMQQRAVAVDEGASSGKNWLIFGNRHYRQDFLYQAEWLQLRERGVLTDADFAWSRDGDEKVYVQDKIAQKSAAIWQWLLEGAHIYVCGNASHMAKSVEQALLTAIKYHGGLDDEAAVDYLTDLRQAGRYQRDVY